jgi:hypothetical protein
MVAMKVSTRQIGRAVTDGTGLTPEQLGLILVGAVVLTGAVVALRAVDLAMRLWTPSGARL